MPAVYVRTVKTKDLNASDVPLSTDKEWNANLGNTNNKEDDCKDGSSKNVLSLDVHDKKENLSSNPCIAKLNNLGTDGDDSRGRQHEEKEKFQEEKHRPEAEGKVLASYISSHQHSMHNERIDNSKKTAPLSNECEPSTHKVMNSEKGFSRKNSKGSDVDQRLEEMGKTRIRQILDDFRKALNEEFRPMALNASVDDVNSTEPTQAFKHHVLRTKRKRKSLGYDAVAQTAEMKQTVSEIEKPESLLISEGTDSRTGEKNTQPLNEDVKRSKEHPDSNNDNASKNYYKTPEMERSNGNHHKNPSLKSSSFPITTNSDPLQNPQPVDKTIVTDANRQKQEETSTTKTCSNSQPKQEESKDRILPLESSSHQPQEGSLPAQGHVSDEIIEHPGQVETLPGQEESKENILPLESPSHQPQEISLPAQSHVTHEMTDHPVQKDPLPRALNAEKFDDSEADENPSGNINAPIASVPNSKDGTAPESEIRRNSDVVTPKGERHIANCGDEQDNDTPIDKHGSNDLGAIVKDNITTPLQNKSDQDMGTFSVSGGQSEEPAPTISSRDDSNDAPTELYGSNDSGIIAKDNITSLLQDKPGQDICKDNATSDQPAEPASTVIVHNDNKDTPIDKPDSNDPETVADDNDLGIIASLQNEPRQNICKDIATSDQPAEPTPNVIVHNDNNDASIDKHDSDDSGILARDNDLNKTASLENEPCHGICKNSAPSSQPQESPPDIIIHEDNSDQHETEKSDDNNQANPEGDIVTGNHHEAGKEGKIENGNKEYIGNIVPECSLTDENRNEGSGNIPNKTPIQKESEPEEGIGEIQNTEDEQAQAQARAEQRKKSDLHMQFGNDGLHIKADNADPNNQIVPQQPPQHQFPPLSDQQYGQYDGGGAGMSYPTVPYPNIFTRDHPDFEGNPYPLDSPRHPKEHRHQDNVPNSNSAIALPYSNSMGQDALLESSAADYANRQRRAGRDHTNYVLPPNLDPFRGQNAQMYPATNDSFSNDGPPGLPLAGDPSNLDGDKGLKLVVVDKTDDEEENVTPGGNHGNGGTSYFHPGYGSRSNSDVFPIDNKAIERDMYKQVYEPTVEPGKASRSPRSSSGHKLNGLTPMTNAFVVKDNDPSPDPNVNQTSYIPHQNGPSQHQPFVFNVTDYDSEAVTETGRTSAGTQQLQIQPHQQLMPPNQLSPNVINYEPVPMQYGQSLPQNFQSSPNSSINTSSPPQQVYTMSKQDYERYISNTSQLSTVRDELSGSETDRSVAPSNPYDVYRGMNNKTFLIHPSALHSSHSIRDASRNDVRVIGPGYKFQVNPYNFANRASILNRAEQLLDARRGQDTDRSSSSDDELERIDEDEDEDEDNIVQNINMMGPRRHALKYVRRRVPVYDDTTSYNSSDDVLNTMRYHPRGPVSQAARRARLTSVNARLNKQKRIRAARRQVRFLSSIVLLP